MHMFIINLTSHWNGFYFNCLIPQERILDHPTSWFDSCLQPRNLHYLLQHTDYVYCVHCLHGRWWHPDSQEGIYNPLPHCSYTKINAIPLCARHISII